MAPSWNYIKAIYLSTLFVINLFRQIPETNYKGIKLNENLITLCLLLKKTSYFLIKESAQTKHLIYLACF